MKYQVVLFDADGVLVKSARQFSDRLGEEFGIDVEAMQPFFKGVFRQCSLGKADLKKELAPVVASWGWTGTVDELMRFWFTKGTEIDEDVASYILALRRDGVRTYLTTDQEKYRGEHLRKTVGGGNLFDEVFFSAEIGCPKKESPFFEQVYLAVGDVPRDQILLVDDSEANVQAARQFGFDGFLFTELKGLREYLSR